MKFLRALFEWIFNPITKSIEVTSSDKLPKFFSRYPSLIVLIAAIATAIIMLCVYFIEV